MPEDGRSESLEIVAEEEDVNEGPTVENRTQNEPGRRDGSSNPESAWLPGFPLVSRSANHCKSGERQDGQQQSYGAFCEYAQTEGRVKRVEPETTSRR